MKDEAWEDLERKRYRARLAVSDHFPWRQWLVLACLLILLLAFLLHKVSAL